MSTHTPESNPLPAPAEEFIASVLRLRPQLAVFDCDGTLWSIDAGEGFFYWEMDRGLLPEKVVRWARPRYEDYRKGLVSEEQMCGEMVTINAGLPCQLLERAATEYFAESVAPVIFPEMQELTRRLAASGCELWAVSSTADWVIRAAAARFHFPPTQVIAVSVEVNDGHCSDRLIRVPTDELKASAIRELLPRTPDAAFGNSIHDLAMLELAQHAFAINPNADLKEIALRRAWNVYEPDNVPPSRR